MALVGKRAEKSVEFVAHPVQILSEMFYFLTQHRESNTTRDEGPFMLC